MIHRTFSIPLSKQIFSKEVTIINEKATTNGCQLLSNSFVAFCLETKQERRGGMGLYVSMNLILQYNK